MNCDWLSDINAVRELSFDMAKSVTASPPPPRILQAPRFSSDPVALTTIPWQWFTESGHLSPANQPCEMSQISPLPHYMVPGYPPSAWFGLSSFGTLVCHSGEGHSVLRVQC